MICYKVLTKNRESCRERNFKVYYLTTRYSQAHYTPSHFGWGLFVFDTLEHAQVFKSYDDYIWEAEGQSSLFLPLNTGNFPLGTMMYKYVMLIKEIT